MIVAVIPARGGSKRIPRKNVKPFCGKPILGWTIEAARASGIFDTVVVSTDDDEIAAVARDFGAETPFRRPTELADDFAPTLPVVGHVVDWWGKHRRPIRLACCIYATAPFLQPQYLHEGLRLLEADAEAEFALSVTSYAFPIFRALKRNADGTVGMFWPENELVRSQDRRRHGMMPGSSIGAGPRLFNVIGEFSPPVRCRSSCRAASCRILIRKKTGRRPR